MKNCPHCGKANDPSAFYCEACGQIIEKPASSDIYTANHREEMYSVTRRAEDALPTIPHYQETPTYANPISYNPYKAGEVYIAPYSEQPSRMQTPYYASPMYPPQPLKQKRSIGEMVLSIILYLFNLFWVSLGLFGFFYSLNQNSTIAGIALVVSALLGIGTLVFLMIKHKKPRLKWWKRLLAFLCVIIIAFIALITAGISVNLIPEANRNIASGIYIGGTMVIFGIIAMVASLL